MSEFTNPFIGKVPDRKLTPEELIRAIRLNLAAEHEAVHVYMAHADATDNPLAKKVLIDIANEERIHAGEFARLISILTGDEDSFLAEGAQEVNQIVSGLNASGLNVPESQDIEKRSVESTVEEATIGSLKR